MTSPNPTAACPKCGSTSLQAVPIKSSSVGKALLTEYFLGTAAGVAASGDTVVHVVCLNCGCQYFPGTSIERDMRALSGQLGEQAKSEVQQRLSPKPAPAGPATASEVGRGGLYVVAWIVLGIAIVVWLYASISR